MRRFGLVGKTLKHSFSKNYFHNKFIREEIRDATYENFEVPSINVISDFIRANPDIKGLNITIPYKEDIIPYLHKRSKIVEKSGACNCIKVEEGGFLSGFNTDVIGFKKALLKTIKPFHTAAMILGSGGASKAISFVLEELGIPFIIVSRLKKPGHMVYEDLDRTIIERSLLIINATPLGMFPNISDLPPVPYQYITKKHFLFDLIYNPPLTPFLQQGKKAGAQIANGYEMLELQAEESWSIWNRLPFEG